MPRYSTSSCQRMHAEIQHRHASYLKSKAFKSKAARYIYPGNLASSMVLEHFHYLNFLQNPPKAQASDLQGFNADACNSLWAASRVPAYQPRYHLCGAPA